MRFIKAATITTILAGAGVALALAGDPTARGVQPVEYPGNFVSDSDDQVCYDMAALGYIGEVTGEMRGYKIDPPASYSDGYVSTTLSADGRYLDWEAEDGVNVLAFIIKGGPSYNLYDYVPYDYQDDQLLHAPVSVKGNKIIIPQISHYNLCYEVQGGTDGCTPGYWRNHYDRWAGHASSDDFDATFGVDLFNPDATLGAVIASPQTYGTFAFHAVAALLNAAGGVPNADGTTVNYPYTTAEVIQIVQDAVASGDTESAKDLLAAANEAGCPLSGTAACSPQNPAACL
jgi:hypothetical protein